MVAVLSRVLHFPATVDSRARKPPSGSGKPLTRRSAGPENHGTRGELIGSRATGGFALAFKADALWVGAATELVDGAAGRLNASQAGVTRVRTALEGSWGFTVGGRVSLTPSVEVGLRRDGGNADTGTGMAEVTGESGGPSGERIPPCAARPIRGLISERRNGPPAIMGGRQNVRVDSL